MKKVLKIMLPISMITGLFFFYACAQPGPDARAGLGIGAVLGGVSGAIIGNQLGDSAAGAAIGAGLGGAVGYGLGQINDSVKRPPYPAPAPGSYQPPPGPAPSGYTPAPSSTQPSPAPPGEYVTVPGRWENGVWIPAHKEWVPVQPYSGPGKKQQ